MLVLRLAIDIKKKKKKGLYVYVLQSESKGSTTHSSRIDVYKYVAIECVMCNVAASRKRRDGAHSLYYKT